MSKHSCRLSVSILVCLFAAWPPCAGAQAPAGAPTHVAAGHKQPAGQTEDGLQRWFAEQDRILDDILTRLARIETLVNDIHRLVAELPSQPARAVPPVKSAREENTATDWLPPLAAGGLALLLLFWWARRRGRMPAGAAVAARAPNTASAKPAGGVDIDLGGDSGQSDQALELADIMLSMGLGHGAAQTLVEQIRHGPKHALRHWLKLLEIYHHNGQQAEFERSAEELRQYFNVEPEDWNARPGARHCIEDYPHIVARLTELWGKPACLVYLQNLLADNRGGTRTGFPQSVAEELLLLASLLKSEGFLP